MAIIKIKLIIYIKWYHLFVKIDGASSISFEEDEELRSKKIVFISGYYSNCFDVSDKYEVFVIGCCNIDGNPKAKDKFTLIKSLSKYKIVAAYAGMGKSLFQTKEGKIFACGYKEVSIYWTNFIF